MGLVIYYACVKEFADAAASWLHDQDFGQTNKMSRLREELQEFVLGNVETFDEERVRGLVPMAPCKHRYSKFHGYETR